MDTGKRDRAEWSRTRWKQRDGTVFSTFPRREADRGGSSSVRAIQLPRVDCIRITDGERYRNGVVSRFR